MSQDPSAPTPRPTFWRTALVVGAAVAAAAGGGWAFAASAPAPSQVVSPPQSPSEFVGITPVRVLDTRGPSDGPIGVPTAGKIGANQSIDVAVAGVGAIPTDATSVAVNITIDQDATLKSFLTVWPTGQTRPLASANNAEPGLVSANSAIFQLGTDGKLSVFNQQGTVNVIMDVTGYFVAAGSTGTTTTTTSTTIKPATATLTTDHTTYVAGTDVIATGTDWTGCTAVKLDIVDSSAVRTNLATDLTVSAAGAITHTFAAPSVAGTYTLEADSVPPVAACHATATIEVTAAP